MIALPVPMIVALLLGYLFVRAVVLGNTTRLLNALLLACALQSMTVSLVHYYGFDDVRPLQPIMASLIPALAWIAFLESAIRTRFRLSDLWHGLAPVIMIIVMFVAPAFIDALLGGLFVGYALAIILALHRQGNDLAHSRLASGPVPALIWRVIAGALIVSALSDALISASLQLGMDRAPGIILSIFSSLAVLVIGFLALSPDLAIAKDHTDASKEDTQPSPSERMEPEVPIHEIMAGLEQVIVTEKLYLDPDLTLARIARRLGYPLKQVSTAINAQTGENVSRYINKFRIDHACAELGRGQNVTTAMLASGFNTKSNFNREFLRITGKTPSQWQQQSLSADT
ncbi:MULTISPECIES: helix-turn-helix domain-containing protein [Thalassospira]|uniref:AraC family transcriptional regulator n=2 Tax=Thalassospira TaxID=168934 RepID=A0A367W9G2_9PROT|nr:MULTISPECIES: AraC family transcriptional regulator [Thalassospira]MDG4718255.1 AraC family transcriptional regulator [Thalassospira sp. FZY0004]RCK38007.1 AraC family transcriptional regulator [Thalassospira profundimaris]